MRAVLVCLPVLIAGTYISARAPNFLFNTAGNCSARLKPAQERLSPWSGFSPWRIRMIRRAAAADPDWPIEQKKAVKQSVNNKSETINFFMENYFVAARSATIKTCKLFQNPIAALAKCINNSRLPNAVVVLKVQCDRVLFLPGRFQLRIAVIIIYHLPA